jgi:hypothetical protein
VRPRFKLRTALIAVTFFCLALGGWRFYTEPYRRARQVMSELAVLNVTVKTEPVVFPKWLRWLPWTSDCFRITTVSSHPMSEHYPGYSEYDLRNRELDDRALVVCGRVNTIEYINFPDTKITDAGLQHLAGMKALRNLSLRETAVSDAGLAALRDLSNLEHVDIATTRVTDAGIAHFANLPKLKSLTIGSRLLTDDCGRHLAKCPSLTRLSLQSPTLTDAVLHEIKDLDLHEFGLYGTQATGRALAECRWQNLDMLTLSLNHLDDEALTCLSNFPKLTYLEVMEPDVTDLAVPHISVLTKLNNLNLSWSSITAAGHGQLVAQMPKCHITFNPNVDPSYSRQYREKLWDEEK